MKGQLTKAIQQAAGTIDLNKKSTYLLCSVSSVDVAKRTCNVATISDAPYDIQDVALMASIDDGMLLVPSADSQVIVAFQEKVQPYIAMYSQLDKVMVVVGDMGITITSDNIQLNDGSYDGLVKISDLVTKLNNLENDINTLKQAFSAWTPSPNDGGAALKGATATWYAQQLQTTKQSDLENTAITHGASL